MKYSINGMNYCISVYEEGSEIPLLIQPTYPNGEPWSSYEDADKWANIFIESFNDDLILLPHSKQQLDAE